MSDDSTERHAIIDKHGYELVLGSRISTG